MTLICSPARDQLLPTARSVLLAAVLSFAAACAVRAAAQAATNPPTIFAHPQSVSQINGFPAWLTVGATGAPPLAYQWRRSGTNLSGATNITYGWSSVHSGLAGSYDVVVTNWSGSVTSATATLTVLPNTASCSLTNLRLVPLNELGAGTHKGYAGGLYPGGLNYRPRAHDEAGRNLARNAIVPRNAAGNPDTNNGRIVLLSIGMSNTTQEWASGANDGTNDTTVAFKYRADHDPSKNPRLVIVDAAQGGRDAPQWTNATTGAWTNLVGRLNAAGVSSNQVQVIWIKQAIASPSTLGAFPAHAAVLQNQLAFIVRAAQARFTNLAIVYLSSRTRSYAADASLNPEPYAYEGGFSVKWFIEQQLNGQLNYDPRRGPVEAPWLAWGPYLWADGTAGRSDRFVWECSDLRSDFTHPSQSGVRKVADQLLSFFKTDPTATPWFLRVSVTGEPPICAPATDITAGLAPLTVSFAANASDPDGTIVETRWTFDDGDFATNANPVKTFPAPGAYSAHLTVTDHQGNTATATVLVNVSLTFDLWVPTHFTATEMTNVAISGRDADADGDGLTNAVEYALGLDPRTASRAGLPAAWLIEEGGQTHLHIIVRRNAAATDVSLFIEASEDLATWEPADAQIAILENTPSVLRLRLNDPISAAPHRFLRIGAETR